MKFISRFSLICCAIGVFINVALGGILLSHNSTSVPLGENSKQETFQKVANHFNLNATEFEEDVELDGDEDLHFTFPEFISSDINEFLFQVPCPREMLAKANPNMDHLWIRKIPLFITYENFRI